MPILKSTIILIAFLLFNNSNSLSANNFKKSISGKIILTIKGFKNTKGNVIISIYKKENTFLDLENAFKTIKKTIKDTTVVFIINDLLPSEYAISIFHDEDENEKMEQWFFFGPPKEGVGISKNPGGMPDFEESSFILDDKDIEIDITMKYIGG